MAAAALALASLACSCLAQDAKDDRAALEEKLRVLDQECHDMEKGVGAPKEFLELRALRKELAVLRRKHDDESSDRRKRQDELWQSAEVKEWYKKISEKSRERWAVRLDLKSNIRQRAAELYQRRHAETAAFAVAKTPRAQSLGFTVLNYPRVDGSTSAQPLGMIIACKILGRPYRWSPTARYSGKWGLGRDEMDPFRDFRPGAPLLRGSRRQISWEQQHDFSLVGYRPVATAIDEEDVEGFRVAAMVNKMLVSHTGTHGAYEKVIRGESDMGLVARLPSTDELDLAKEKGVELEAIPFALDAFVFIKNHKNPVESLTIKQIQDIYAGKITNWSAVGGGGSEIRACQRNRNSGSQELMETLVMKDIPFKDVPERRAPRTVLYGMVGPFLALSQDEKGIAYSVYYYEHFMAGSPDTELLAVNGVLPSYETIHAGEYPYVTKVYVVTRKGLAPDSQAAKLRNWLLSEEGQAVVRESGYVPIR
jgi:phosphate transport system substrate-binding protein